MVVEVAFFPLKETKRNFTDLEKFSNLPKSPQSLPLDKWSGRFQQ